MDVTSLQKRPKQPFTPLYAFVAAKQLKLKKDNPYLSASERLVRRRSGLGFTGSSPQGDVVA